jgi:poly-gamma-glutamate capsule biosynthesis protein CapA/YwtB (metallophosphatase superfamily)
MSYGAEGSCCRITLAGDCMPTRRISIYDDPNFLALAEIFRTADVGFVNLETVVRRSDEGAPGIQHGTYMTTSPELLEELKWFGINLVSCANNHAFDYGEGGVLATIKHLDAAGLAHAGSGRNLADARMPGYLDTQAGRVALLSTTATFSPWHRAGDQRPDVSGRPGISCLGSKKAYRLDRETFHAFARASRELGFDQTRSRNRGHFYSEAEAPPEREGRLDAFGQTFELADSFGAISKLAEQDVADILRWVREARRQADWVIFSYHSHEFSHDSMARAKVRTELDEPAEFVPDLARAIIDAGADVFVGHGSHTPLGIEIYKGKPIFYSLGNFVFQNETVPSFPADAYARFNLGPDATPADFLDVRTANGKKGHVAHAGFWENIVATVHFDEGRLKEVAIHPIEQGFGRSRSQRGRPVLANAEIGASIIERIGKLSARYGTKVQRRDHVGIIGLT